MDKFYVEDQSGIGRNGSTGTTGTVTQTVGDEETVLGTFLHELQTLGPTGDHLLQGEGGGLSTLVTAVEHRTVDERTLVVAHYRILGRWLLTVTLLEHLVLQTAGKGDHTLVLGVLGQVFLTCLLMYLTLLVALSLELLLLLLKIVLYNHLGIAMRHLQFTACQHILDSLCKIVGINLLGTHLGQLLTDA